MKRLSVVKAYINVLYWLVLMLAAVILTLAIYNHYPILIQNWFITFTSVITLFGTFVTLKDLSQKFQRFIYKSRVILRNRQIAWSLAGKYYGEGISSLIFFELKEFLKELGDNNTIISEKTYNISLNIDGIVIQCIYREQQNENIFSETENVGEISFYIPEYHAPYVEANVLLEQRILPVLNNIKSKIGECSETFTFDVYFKKQHPYLGLYLRGLDRKNISNLSFNCSFIEAPSMKGINDESVVTVSRKKLSFSTKNLYSLDRLIHKHLFLSGG
ncbi:hypothetical protein F3157_03715 [Virgibacillus dakarensis]|nr:hypothetical protein [Virgibacillus dakarensis]MTW84766.1 hypothetical protein [Virgibacillus dakarensis]